MRNKLTLTFKSGKTLRFLAVFMAFSVCLMLSGNIYSQEKQQITGTVVESTSGLPLPGVTVLIKGTSIGSITGLDGKYSISASPTDVLVFSYMGYLSEEKTVGTSTVLDISMVDDIIGLDEVVVTGYGVQKKSDLTGAIASVSGEDLTKVPGGTFDEALKGRAAGVFSSTESGAPGSNPVIRIRGISSINGGDPIFIVDGVPMSIYSIASLNPNDIKSVEVLKDASSQAIYGASGGNGVVQITTKQGEKNKLVTELNYYYGLQNPYKHVDMMSTQEFFEVYNTLDIPEANRLGWSDDTIATLPNVDWQSELLRNAPMHNIGLSISGGTDNSTYRFSTGYYYQDGVVPNSKYQRFNLRLNSLSSVTKRIKFGENISLSNEQYSGFQDYYYNHPFLSPVLMAVQMHPFVEPYNPDAGDWNNWNVSPVSNLRNPFMYVDITDRDIPSYSADGDLNLTVDIIKGLSYKTILGGGVELGFSRIFTPVYYFSPQLNNNLSTIQRQAWRNYNWYWQHTMTYIFSLGNHNFTLMGGYESGYYLNEGMDATRYDLINETREMHYFDASLNADDMIVTDYSNTPQDVASAAMFGRINYDYKEKYLLTATLRKDISSRFGPLYRDGIFPSISMGWKFSEEEFMKSQNLISFGKIRGGWGQIGNSGGRLDPYRYYAQVVSTNVYNYPMDNTGITAGAAAHGIPNQELHWEAMEAQNYGFDLTLLNNSISLSADYYIKKNDGMIIQKPTPDFSGTFQESAGNEGGSTSLVANIGEVRNSGFEITAGYKNMKGQFKHNININFSYAENEVVDIGGDTIISTTGIQFFNSLTFTAEGQPMGLFYGYRTDGLFRPEDAEMIDGELVVTNQPSHEEGGEIVYAQPYAQPGDVKFVDVNGDGDITDDDRVPIGDPHPKYLLGINYDLTYKIFDLSMFWQGAFGHDIMMITKTWMYNNNGSANWHRDAVNRYTDENTTADLFRFSYADANNNDRMSDFYIEKGNYIRLKNIQLGVTLPQNIISKVGIDNLRVYVGAKDLITFTKYPGVDPEVAENRDPLFTGIDISAYPRPRVFTFGFNATF